MHIYILVISLTILLLLHTYTYTPLYDYYQFTDNQSKRDLKPCLA